MATAGGPHELGRKEGFPWWFAALSMGTPAGHGLLATLGKCWVIDCTLLVMGTRAVSLSLTST